MRLPGFGIWKWKKGDYRTPLALNTPNGKALIYVKDDKDHFTKSGINVMPYQPVEKGAIDRVSPHGET